MIPDLNGDPFDCQRWHRPERAVEDRSEAPEWREGEDDYNFAEESTADAEVQRRFDELSDVRDRGCAMKR